MNVVFLEPAFPANQRAFVLALAGVGATVIGIGERHVDELDDELKAAMLHYEQVHSVVDEGALYHAVRTIQDRIWVDRLEATVEAHIMAAAHVREACTIPGTSARTAYLCRDKPSMKEVLRAAGVPCAASTGASSVAEVEAFVAEVGFPVILKPRDAAGASGTHRADDPGQLTAAMQATGVDHGAPIAVEEYIEGHEGFYDTITIDGQVVHDFVSHYYPNVLDAMRHRWISPQFIATNRVDEPGAYDEVKELGRRVIEALELGTSATHMEWFFGPKGLTFSEIGCRPPGVRAWDLYAAGNDIDIYREWAMAVVHGQPSQGLSRRFSAGIIALRPQHDGVIAGYAGLDRVQEQFGEWIIDFHLPPDGTPTQPVEAGYMANAWIRLKHPDYDHLRWMLDTVGQTVTVWAR
jgi:formate-dependent phosphoribosylglycinamide formyltransferase (GAR transformylase)